MSKQFRILTARKDAAIYNDCLEVKKVHIGSECFALWQGLLSPKQQEHVLSECQSQLAQGVTSFAIPWTKPPKAIFFDMDATVIEQESIVELARACGKEAEVAAVTDRAMRGEVDFIAALEERVRHLAGLPQSIFPETLRRLRLQAGIRELADAARGHGIKLFLVSGGFRDLAQPICDQLGFTACHANTLLREKGVLTGKVGLPVVDGLEKRRFVKEVMANYGYDREDIIVIGDGANDQLMMGESAVAIGYHPKSALVPALNGAVFQGSHNTIWQIIANE